MLIVWQLRNAGVVMQAWLTQQHEYRNRGNTYFIPTIQFTTLAGELVETEFDRECAPTEFIAAQQVAVRYDPQRPTTLLLTQRLADRHLYWPLLFPLLFPLFV